MVMKVSTSMFFDRASAQLANVQGNLAKTQEQLSTGKQITKPSDEPDKASLVTRLESEIARQKSYQESIKAIEIRRKAEETALNSTSDVMFRMKELSVQAANDTLGAADRKTIALEMTELRNQILSLANSQDSNGNYLFAGSRVSQMPFSPDAKGVIVYKGDQARMVVGVGDNRRMNQNIPGSDAFINVVRDDGKGGRVGIGFFQAMGDLIEAVKSSNRVAIQRGISEIDTLQQGLECGGLAKQCAGRNHLALENYHVGHPRFGLHRSHHQNEQRPAGVGGRAKQFCQDFEIESFQLHQLMGSSFCLS